MKMRRWGQRGSAVVEFTLFAVVAIVPLSWAALSLQQLVAVQQAAQGAAAESLRAYLTAPSQALAEPRADVAAGLVLAELPAVADFDVEVSCGQSRCLTPGTAVRVQVVALAELPQIPVLGLRPAMRATAQQYGVVDAYVAPR